MKKQIYLGPAAGLYERNRFSRFIESLDFKRRMKNESLEVNKEGYNQQIVMYHMPQQRVGIQYTQIIEGIVSVDAFSAESESTNAENIEKVILEEANKRTTRLDKN